MCKQTYMNCEMLYLANIEQGYTLIETVYIYHPHHNNIKLPYASTDADPHVHTVVVDCVQIKC